MIVILPQDWKFFSDFLAKIERHFQRKKELKGLPSLLHADLIRLPFSSNKSLYFTRHNILYPDRSGLPSYRSWMAMHHATHWIPVTLTSTVFSSIWWPRNTSKMGKFGSRLASTIFGESISTLIFFLRCRHQKLYWEKGILSQYYLSKHGFSWKWTFFSLAYPEIHFVSFWMPN